MKRFLSLILVFSLILSSFVLPSSAVGFEETPVIAIRDMNSVSAWTEYWQSKLTLISDLTSAPVSLLQSCMDSLVSKFVPGSKSTVQRLVTAVSGGDKLWLESLKSVSSNPLTPLPVSLLGIEVDIGIDPETGYYRPFDKISGIPIVNSRGEFPYYVPTKTDSSGANTPDPDLGGQWRAFNTVNWTRVHLMSEYALYDMGFALRDAGTPNDVSNYRNDTGSLNYQYLRNTSDQYMNQQDYVYCDEDGWPYVSRLNSSDHAVDTEQKYYPEDDDDDGEHDDGEAESSQIIDVDAGIIVMPGGEVNYIDNLVYDESTKTYYVDAHEEYNTTNNTFVTNNYHIEYHINYTSVTYVGSTDEYETYEYYYELPDGRSSADLTAEELQVLNTQIDVLPYIRSADDTSIRALYHFDGDCLDSSYWSHLGSLSWITGASITYMDANTFNGALYLDENEHDFKITLPSNFGSQDFTIQWRYYQSHTLAPVTDSSFSVGDTVLLQFNGSSILNAAGNVLSSVSVGSWQEIALVRKDGVITVFLNGIPIGRSTNSLSMGNTLRFVFGADQQTYKYFDELRVTNKALYVTSYTPSSVPFDTNLALVLPDSQLPVADEYWSFNTEGNLLEDYDFSNTPITSDWLSTQDYEGRKWINMNGRSSWCTNICNDTFHVYSYDGFVRLENTSSSDTYKVAYIPENGMARHIWGINDGSISASYIDGVTFAVGDSYTFSVLLSDGTYLSLPFVVSTSSFSYSLPFPNGGQMMVTRSTGATGAPDYYGSLVIVPPAGGSVDVVYMELKAGEPNTDHEFVSSVVVMDKDDLNTPSLAVRTDIDIKGYQLGGVRPSLPTKGLVWALVESGRITSLQIYNGQAWEAVDGRIWTGSRWVPYYAYDVLLLKDLWDIVESDPTLDPIYTETGFWTWLQNSWGDMLDKLDQIIDGLGGSGGSGGSGSGSDDTRGFWDKIADAFTNGLAALIEAAFDMISTILKTLLSLVTDMLSFIFGFVTETVLGAIGDFFSIFTDGSLLDGFQQTDENGNTTTQLPDGVGTVFTEMSGFFTALPSELSSVLIFGIGLLFFIAVIKLV